MIHKKCLGVTGVIFGTVLVVVVGIIGWLVVPSIIDNQIKQNARLTNPDTLEQWKHVKVPIQLKFYIFNITNPEALEQNERLNFVEHGPYVYNVKRSKNVSISEDEITATYRETSHYYFDRQLSNGTEKDVFSIPNVPLIALAHAAYAKKTGEELDGPVTFLISFLAGLEGLIKTKVTVREILFKGWPLAEVLNGIPEDLKPNAFKGGRFGFYKNKNGTDDGEYVVLTGDKNHEEFGHIVSWEKKEELNWWYTKGLNKSSNDHFCNKINGSDGSIFPPFVTKETTLRLFNPDLCRSIWFTFDSETSFRDIPSYKFKIPSETFAGPTCNRNNKCFCQKQHPQLNHHCWSGTTRLFKCRQGAPIVSSFPHFLDGDEELFEAINIVKPRKDLHESHMEIEPLSGVVLSASIKLQVNVELQHLPNVSDFEDLNFTKYTESPSILLPIFWIDQEARVDNKHAKELRTKVTVVVRDIDLGKWALIAVGGLIMAASAILLVGLSKRTEKV
jgi:lysosome membrane protein 2